LLVQEVLTLARTLVVAVVELVRLAIQMAAATVETE
jgi:hypothetical protein